LREPGELAIQGLEIRLGSYALEAAVDVGLVLFVHCGICVEPVPANYHPCADGWLVWCPCRMVPRRASTRSCSSGARDRVTDDDGIVREQVASPARLCPSCKDWHPVGTLCMWPGRTERFTIGGHGHPLLTTREVPIEVIAARQRDTITLTKEESKEAAECGKKRLQTKVGSDKLGKDSQVAHVMGSRAERAMSRWLNEHGIAHRWTCTIHEYGGVPDVAGLQVRCQRRTAAHWGSKVKKDDPDRTPVASWIEESAGVYRFRGWIWAGEAKKPEWLKDPGGRGYPNWFAPDENLRPIDTLLTTTRVRAAMGLPPEGM
jgi:hypothetical protein